MLNASVIRKGRPYPPDSIAALVILPGVEEALSQLRAAGYLNVVVTNQPDVATGKQRIEVVEAMHDRLLSELPLDEVKAWLTQNNAAVMAVLLLVLGVALIGKGISGLSY